MITQKNRMKETEMVDYVLKIVVDFEFLWRYIFKIQNQPKEVHKGTK